MSILLAILSLGLLIIVHEGGHYFVARWCKMRVERFSIGFGPALLKWKGKETQFQVSPILLGGYVQITGMNPHDEYDPQDPTVYPNRPTWQRFVAIFAGPATNYLFAVLIIFFVFAAWGVPAGSTNTISAVQPGMPAEGVLQDGDVILEVGGTVVSPEEQNIAAVFREAVQKYEGEAVPVKVQRAGEAVTVEIKPEFDENRNAYMMGIGFEPRYEDVGLLGAAAEALEYPVYLSARILEGIAAAVRNPDPEDWGGPVRITSMISQGIEQGWLYALQFLAMLNVYLGLFNLLPVPALDGGRLVFLGYELVTRRRPNPKVEAVVHMVGFAFLFVLMILVTFKDIQRLFS